MEKLEAMTAIKQFVMEHGLPRMDLALFGVKCPYCGKSDRIRQLEPPRDLNGDLSTSDLETYAKLWKALVEEDARLGLCKFCLNPLRLDLDENRAEPLFD